MTVPENELSRAQWSVDSIHDTRERRSRRPPLRLFNSFNKGQAFPLRTNHSKQGFIFLDPILLQKLPTMHNMSTIALVTGRRNATVKLT